MLENQSKPYKVITSNTCQLGEGPVWDSKRQSICWGDIIQGHIHECHIPSGGHRKIELGEMVGSYALTSDGNFIAALQHGFAFVNRESSNIKRIIDPEKHLPGNRFNEGKCDPAGRFWAGTMALDESEGAGNLYMLQHDLTYELKVPQVSISNGLAWSLDHQIMYYIDTPTLKVFAFDYDEKTASINNRRAIISIPENEGFPDGMTIDNEGMLWIAHWGGWQITRWNPQTGEKLTSFSLPVANVTSCTFGGNEFRDIYITTAKKGLTEEELAKQPLAGSLFVIENSDYQGMEPDIFSGNLL